MKLRKVYVLICDKTGDWYAMCANRFPDQPGPDCHQELWELDKYENVTYREVIMPKEKPENADRDRETKEYQDKQSDKLLDDMFKDDKREVDLGNSRN